MKLSDDPYALGKVILPELVTKKKNRGKDVKLLVLMGIKADGDKKAYRVYRNSHRENKIGQNLTGIQLAALLDPFIDKHPQFKRVLKTGQAHTKS